MFLGKLVKSIIVVSAVVSLSGCIVDGGHRPHNRGTPASQGHDHHFNSHGEHHQHHDRNSHDHHGPDGHNDHHRG